MTNQAAADLLEALIDHARCTSCRATNKRCQQLRETNDDPTAPDWFGCCAPGLGPCQHVITLADARMALRAAKENLS